MDSRVELAQKTIKEYLENGKVFDSDNAPKELLDKHAGCFVSIHKSDGELRGCIGTILPTCKNLAAEIVNNAISAATRDPRFQPITKEENPDLEISVDVLSEPEPIPSEANLEPKKYGCIVKTEDGRTGLLLPDLEDVNTASQQIAICKQKANINPNESCYLYRFTVIRHK